MGKAGKLDLEMKEILRSFEQAEKDTRSLPLNPPPADEFDRIWTRIQAERDLIPEPVSVTKPGRRRINKIFAVGVAAAVLTVGGCFVAMGTKSYFYRDGRRVSNGVVYNNDSNVITIRDEEEAYEKVSEELGVKNLKLGYMPNEMYFEDVLLGNGYGKLQYRYKDERVFFIQAKSNTTTSSIRSSDAVKSHEVQNAGLHMSIEVYKEKIEGNATTYEAQFVYDGVCYYLIGVMDKKDFDEVVKRIQF